MLIIALLLSDRKVADLDSFDEWLICSIPFYSGVYNSRQNVLDEWLIIQNFKEHMINSQNQVVKGIQKVVPIEVEKLNSAVSEEETEQVERKYGCRFYILINLNLYNVVK